MEVRTSGQGNKLWLHSLPSTHDLLANLLSKITKNLENTLDWLPDGLKNLISKSKEKINEK